MEKCDIVVKLLVRTQLVPLHSESAAVFLYDRTSKLSDWKLRSRVDNMDRILKASKEPALLMKHLLQQLMKQDICCNHLKQAGLEVTRELLGRREWASLVANRLSNEMISQRRGLPQQSMALSIKHGVSVIQEVGLKSTVHGDKDLLATVIR